MTLTKYQKGELMEGWNDCPPMMVQSLNSSSSSVDKKGKQSDKSKSPSSSTIPFDESVNITEVVEEFLQMPNSLPDKMLSQIKAKLFNGTGTMKDSHKRFVCEISLEAKNGSDAISLKNKIIEFMMVNDGVSSWCVPLKKFVEGLSQ